MGGSGSFTYSWLPVGSLSNPSIPNPVATPTATTTYYVIVDDGDNTITDQVTVTVNPVPEQPEITQAGSTLISNAATGNQWYNSDGMISGATSQSYSPNSTSNFYVIVSNEFDCESEPSEAYYFIYTGLIELAEGQNVNVYPNPFNDKFTLDYSLTSASSVKVSIYNTYGQLMTIIGNGEIKSTGNHRILFNASNFDPGIYYLKFETNDYSLIKRIVHSK